MYKSNRNILKRLAAGFTLAIGLALLILFNTHGIIEESAAEELAELNYFEHFRLEGLDGETFTENDIHAHKLTVVNAWAPWCTYCVAEMPDLEKLSKEYAAQDVYFVGVVGDYYLNQQKHNAEWMTGYDADIRDEQAVTGISYPSVLADQDFNTYMLPTMHNSFPGTWAVDQSGKIIGFRSGSADEEAWREQINEWLKEVS